MTCWLAIDADVVHLRAIKCVRGLNNAASAKERPQDRDKPRVEKRRARRRDDAMPMTVNCTVLVDCVADATRNKYNS